MPLLPRTVLKSFFQTGDKPTASQFAAFIDSTIIYTDDFNLLGLKPYDPARAYVTGDSVIYNKIIYQAKQNISPEPFDINKWDKIAGSTPGSVNYKGTWDADTNNPDIEASSPGLGDYYVVSVAGNTPLNDPPNVVDDWNIGDWAIFNGTLWEKVDNSDSVTGASNAGTGAGSFKDISGTLLRFRSLLSNNGSLTVTENSDDIDLSIQFGDSGTSASRAWSAFKIDSELAGKQPLIGYTPEDVANKVTSISITSTDAEYPSAKLLFDKLALKQDNLGYTAENVANKVISISGSSTDTEYPTAKLLFDQLALKQNNLGYTAENDANKVSSISGSSTNIQYPGAKLLFDQLALKQDVIPYTTENIANKVSALSGASTNIQYPGAKLVFDELALKQDSLQYLSVESGTAVATSTVKPSFADYSPGGFKLSTGTRSGNYRIQWCCLVQCGTRAGQFQLKNITSASPQLVGTVDMETKTTNDIVAVTWAGIVALSGVNQDFVIQFNTQLAGQPVTIHRAFIEITKV